MNEFFIVLFLSTSLISMFLLIGVLLPGLVKSTRENYEKTPSRAFWLGMVNVLFLGVVLVGIVFLMQSAGIQFLLLLAAPLAGVILFVMVVGAAAITQSLGVRLFPKQAAIKQQIYGGLVTILACLLPFVGWFLLTGYLLLSGFGGVVISYYDWRSNRKAAKSK